MPNGLLFIADAMVGRLARWLRLLGFDTLYYPDISDSELLKIAIRDGRIILTRDTHFLKRKNPDSFFFMHSDNARQQIAEVITGFNINEFGPGRCARCNGMLEEAGDKEKIKSVVPEYVFLNNNIFFKCHDCGKVYWEGTHLKRFRGMIKDITNAKEDR